VVGAGAGQPSLMYKNPTPCGVNAWRPFRSDAQMECLDLYANAGDSNDKELEKIAPVTPTDASAITVSAYDGTVSTYEDEDKDKVEDEDEDAAELGSAVAHLSHPARRLLTAGGSSDPSPGNEGSLSQFPVEKDYSGVFYSMHLGVRLSLEILDGLNDNYMAFSAQFRFMSFPGISVEMSIIPSQGMNAAFYFKINMWEVLQGVVDLLLAAITTLIATALSGMYTSFLFSGGAFSGLPVLTPGATTQLICNAIEKLKEAAIEFAKDTLNSVLAILGIDVGTIMKWISSAGFDGDDFEFTG